MRHIFYIQIFQMHFGYFFCEFISIAWTLSVCPFSFAFHMSYICLHPSFFNSVSNSFRECLVHFFPYLVPCKLSFNIATICPSDSAPCAYSSSPSYLYPCGRTSSGKFSNSNSRSLMILLFLFLLYSTHHQYCLSLDIRIIKLNIIHDFSDFATKKYTSFYIFILCFRKYAN